MLMKTSTFIALLAIIIIAGAVWYSYSLQEPQLASTPSGAMGTNGSLDQGNMGGPATGTPQQPQGDGTGPAQNLTLGTDGNAQLGTYLIGYNGMTLYTYAKDSVGTTTCYGQCAQVWPPYTVPPGMQLNLQYGVTGNAGTLVRADGTTQVTYNGLPLYFYSGDTSGSQTNGQGLGGVWYVVQP